MSAFFHEGERRVIPNFRSLKKTRQLGELNSSSNLEQLESGNIKSYIEDFLDNSSMAYAGDLLSAALSNNKTEDEVVKQAANFVLAQSSDVPFALKEIASYVLHPQETSTQVNINKIEDFLEQNNLPGIYQKIHALRLRSSQSDFNPFVFTELARLYSIIGEEEAAKKSIHAARHLAPNNRYILRSFARLMTHFHEPDTAHEILRKNSSTKTDPWLLSAEISLATLRGKTSNLIKIGANLIQSERFDFLNITELASSIGTLERQSGNRKKTKSMLEIALKHPNDNSLAQVEWINHKENLFDLDVFKFGSQNYEANTLSNFNARKWEETIKNAEMWFLDMPFATRAVSYAHQAASFYLEDQETAIKFCRAGLIANPSDPRIINNIAFSYATLNDPTNAFFHLSKIQNIDAIEDSVKICLLATKGLAYYRSNQPFEGKRYYFQAISLAKKNGNRSLADFALLHLVKEELLSRSLDAKVLFEEAMKINPNDSFSVSTIKSRIQKIFEREFRDK